MKKGNILIVDDNKNVLSALRILLSDYFENIVLLTSPNTLMSELRDKNPDVVLLDMNFSAGINSGNEGDVYKRQRLCKVSLSSYFI